MAIFLPRLTLIPAHYYLLVHLICQLVPRFRQTFAQAAPAAGSDAVDISSSPSWPSELCLQSCITGYQCGVCQGYSLAQMSGCQTNSCFCASGNLEIAYNNLVACRAYNCFYYNYPVYSDPYTLLVGYCKWVGMPSTPSSTADTMQITPTVTRYIDPGSSTLLIWDHGSILIFLIDNNRSSLHWFNYWCSLYPDGKYG